MNDLLLLNLTPSLLPFILAFQPSLTSVIMDCLPGLPASGCPLSSLLPFLPGLLPSLLCPFMQDYSLNTCLAEDSTADTEGASG